MRVFTWDFSNSDYYTNVGFVCIKDGDSLDTLEALIKKRCHWLTVDTERLNVSNGEDTAYLCEITTPGATIVSHAG